MKSSAKQVNSFVLHIGNNRLLVVAGQAFSIAGQLHSQRNRVLKLQNVKRTWHLSKSLTSLFMKPPVHDALQPFIQKGKPPSTTDIYPILHWMDIC